MSDEKNINYYIAKANFIKLGGYNSVDGSFVKELLEYFYDSNRIFKWYEKRYGSLSGTYYMLSFTGTLDKSDMRLVSSATSKKLSDIYKKALFLEQYREFAFILFLLGIVNPYDYLKSTRNIDFVVSKFRIGGTRAAGRSDLIRRIDITYHRYAELMCMYIRCATEGVDFGFSVYDFIYHALNAEQSRTGYLLSEKFEIVYELIQKKGVFSTEHFLVGADLRHKYLFSKEFLGKYVEEIGCIFPLIYKDLEKKFGKDRVVELLLYILDNSDDNLVRLLMLDKILIMEMGMMGVQFKG